MQNHTYNIRVDWDGEAEVWYVAESDVPGLACEAETPEGILTLLKDLVPELVDLNNGDDQTPDIPYNVMLEQLKATRIRA